MRMSWETLSTVEETCVREKAVESLCRVGSQMKETDLVEHFIPLVKVSQERRITTRGFISFLMLSRL